MGQCLAMLCQYCLSYFTDITQLQAYIDKQSQLEDIKYSCYKLNTASTNLLLCICSSLKN